MSARRLAALVIKLAALYMMVLGVVNVVGVLATHLAADDQSPFYGNFILLSVQMAFTLVFCIVALFVILAGNKIATLVLPEDWAISSGVEDGHAFWRKTVPVLVVSGFGLLLFLQGTERLLQNVNTFVTAKYFKGFLDDSRILLGMVTMAAYAGLGLFLTLRPVLIVRLLRIADPKE